MAAPRDTIFARASGGGRAAVAVLRVSGPAAGDALASLTGRLPLPRLAALASVRDPASGGLLDRALVFWFPAPASFTGEDAAELHLHGGRAVVAAVLRALASLPGLRPAEPGEFTERAFRNGKLDLAQVEGLADLVDADTEAQRRQAMRQVQGALARWVADLRERLVEALALVEGMIDFAEDDGLIGTAASGLRADVEEIRARVARELARGDKGERLARGLVVTIAGTPNVGKSTLLNALAGREVAIVSAHAGTTRDAIEVDLALGPHVVRLVDTAGLRDSADPVEQEGIARAKARAETSDLVLWLRASDRDGAPRPETRGALWTIATKHDLGTGLADADHHVSAYTGEGMSGLVEALARFADAELAGAEDAVVTRLRHRAGLQAALTHLDAVLSPPGLAALELAAESLRAASDALAGLVGPVENEEVLGSIFARFCIGK